MNKLFKLVKKGKKHVWKADTDVSDYR